MLSFSVTYQLKPTPSNMNPSKHTVPIPISYVKEFGQSPMAAMQYALDCFSMNGIAYLAIYDQSDEITIIKG